MACFSGTIRSSVMSMDTGLQVILPYDRPAEASQKTPCKVLYLLHGLGDNCAAWTRYTAIESYARDKGIAVIMPEVQRSFYYDMAHGCNYFTYLTQELPALCGEMFNICSAREDTYVAGLSMGGYGALKCALRFPEQYCAAASFSGCVDIVSILETHGDIKSAQEFRAALGMDLSIQDSDNLFLLAEKVSSLPREHQPDIFLTCGTEDFLHEDNLRFKSHLESLPIRFRYEQWPGEHVWSFWDESIRKTLDYWLP